MSITVQSDPAQKRLVAQCIMNLSYEDFRDLVNAIEVARNNELRPSRKKVNAETLTEAVYTWMNT